MSGYPVEPRVVVEQVEQYVDEELRDARKYENSTPLDESGVGSLHRLAANIYAIGFADGESASRERELARRRREMETS